MGREDIVRGKVEYIEGCVGNSGAGGGWFFLDVYVVVIFIRFVF